MNFEQLTAMLDGPKEGKYRCPVHNGYSLSVKRGEYQSIVAYCFGCEARYPEVLEALGVARPRETSPSRHREKSLPATQNQPANFSEVWKAAKPADPNHPYLVRKGVGVFGIRQADSSLLLPMHSGELVGLQSIHEDGTKRTWPGSRMKNAYFYLTPVWASASHVWLAEGYATASTLVMVAQSLGFEIPVVCAYTAGNLPGVAEILHCSRRELYIAADNDSHKADTGWIQADKAMDHGASYVVMPDEPGDWNDHMLAHGLERTAEEIYGD